MRCLLTLGAAALLAHGVASAPPALTGSSPDEADLFAGRPALLQLSEHGVQHFRTKVPPSAMALSVKLEGCPRRGGQADGVRTYLAIGEARPSARNAHWSVGWCDDAPLLIERGSAHFPASSDELVLHASVLAHADAVSSISVQMRGFDEAAASRTLRVACHRHGSYSPALGGLSPNCTSVQLPVDARTLAPADAALAVHIAAPSLSEELQHGVGAALSFTASDLRKLPASWYLPMPGDVVVRRDSAAFCELALELACTATLSFMVDRELFERLAGAREAAVVEFEVRLTLLGVAELPPAGFALADALPADESRASAPMLDHRECAPGCPIARVSNGVCDEACMNTACRHDGGDCSWARLSSRHQSGLAQNLNEHYPHPHPSMVSRVVRNALGHVSTCVPGCRVDWIGDGVCDDACFVEACWWDENDCTAAVRAAARLVRELPPYEQPVDYTDEANLTV